MINFNWFCWRMRARTHCGQDTMTEPSFFTTDELLAKKNGVFVFDVESFENYFLVAFQCYETGKICYFEAIDNDIILASWLIWMFDNFCVVGFNSNDFDLPLVSIAATGRFTPKELQAATRAKIVDGVTTKDLQKQFCFELLSPNHIDLIEVAPLTASLKTYAGRLHCKHMQDLPFDPNTKRSEEHT